MSSKTVFLPCPLSSLLSSCRLNLGLCALCLLGGNGLAMHLSLRVCRCCHIAGCLFILPPCNTLLSELQTVPG